MVKTIVDPTQQVDEYLKNLDHPFKAEVQKIREIIKSVNPQITEEVKWNAPSFSYTEYIVTFNLHVTKHVHLVFHNPRIMEVTSEILEGNYKDRKMIFFTSMQDVLAKEVELKRIVGELVTSIEKFPKVLEVDEAGAHTAHAH